MKIVLKDQIYKKKNVLKPLRSLIPLLGLIYLFFKNNIAWFPGWSCPLRHATGVPCPTCFLTRSVSASLNGELSDAFNFHLLGPPTALFLIYWSFKSLKSGLLYPFKIRSKIYYLLGIIFIIYWCYRLISYYLFGNEAFPI